VAQPAVPPPATNDTSWHAIVSADRLYYGRCDPEEVPFPADFVSKTFALDAPSVSIGRRSASRRITPEIDLSGEPEDLGVSHLHAVLIRRIDGGWSLIDPGSTNGTTLNDSTAPIAPNAAVPLRDGDQIHIGAWTTITIRSAPGGA
jgi:hypothetical protein